MEIKNGHMTAPSVDVAGKCLPRVSVLLRSGLRALDFSMSVDVVSSSHLGRVVVMTPCSLSFTFVLPFLHPAYFLHCNLAAQQGKAWLHTGSSSML